MTAPKCVFVTRAEEMPGVSLDICNNGVHGMPKGSARPFDPNGDALKVYDALVHLPVETRRRLQQLITENADTFGGATRAKNEKTKKQPFPSRRGGK